MASENKKTPGGPAATPSGPPPSMQEYRKEQARLRDMIDKQKQLSQRLAQLEDSISQKESAYLDSTPHGNIITGYDGYIKGSGSAAHRKKPPPLEQNRVFTRSSISYRPNTSGDATPGSATPAAQTPVSATASGNATPTSANVARGGSKKKKVDDESEPDSAPANSKKRTAFGAVRK